MKLPVEKSETYTLIKILSPSGFHINCRELLESDQNEKEQQTNFHLQNQPRFVQLK